MPEQPDANAAVSVVMPAYNAARTIRRALDSILAQTRPPLEVLVVDDASRDDTAEIVQSYGEPVQLIRQAHSERSAARNRGIQSAQGRYLAFLDVDDWWRPSFLERMTAVLESHPATGVVFCTAERYGPAGEFIEAGSPAFVCEPATGAQVLEPLALGHCFPLPAAVVRKSCVEQVGGFNCDLSQFEDWDLWLRIATQARFGFVPDALACWAARDKYLPHEFAAHGAVDARLAIVEAALAAAQAAAFLRQRARAQALWFAGLTYLALGDEQPGRARLAEAGRVRERLLSRPDADWLADLLHLAMFLFDTLAPEWLAMAYVRQVFGNLPSNLRDLAGQERRVLGQLGAAYGFYYRRQGQPARARRAMRMALRIDPGLVRNPGILSTAAWQTPLAAVRPLARAVLRRPNSHGTR